VEGRLAATPRVYPNVCSIMRGVDERPLRGETGRALSPDQEAALKPELTFGRALRQLARWWPLVVLAAMCAAIVAAAAGVGAVSYRAEARVNAQDTTIAFSNKGDPQPFTPNRSVNDASRSDFVVTAPAQEAARELGDVTAQALARGIGFEAVTGYQAILSYTARSREVAERRLQAYVDAFVEYDREVQLGPIRAAEQTVRSADGSRETIAQLETAADTIEQQVYQVGEMTSSAGNRLPRWLGLLGAAAAGALLGLLVAFAAERLDPVVRRGADVRASGVRSLEIDSRRGAGALERLRASVELAGVGASGGVVAVTAAGAHDASPAATALARAFAASGRPTALLAGTGAGETVEVEPRLTAVRLPELRHASLPVLMGAIEAARARAEVVVVEAPGVDAGAGALLSAALADMTVLVVHRGRSTWRELEAALDALADAAAEGRVQVCVERGRGEPPLGLVAGARLLRRRRTGPAAARS
jgi:hypothetical protein